jgi:hypothetical protein
LETSSRIKILNLKDALLLYDLIGKHIPKDIDENTEILNFIGKIVDSIIEANEHRRYIDAIMLMSYMTQEEILSIPVEEVIMLFSEGLISNHVLLLCKFCEELGYGSS